MRDLPRTRVAVLERTKPQLDPVIAAAIIVILAIVGWSALPDAWAVSDNANTDISLTVDPGVAVVPAFTSGSTALKLADITIPGQQSNASSTGWALTNNSWFPGYAVSVKSVSSPALRGKNAVDGKGVSDSFTDFTVGGCPCTWSTSGIKKGLFGYSVSGSANFVDASSTSGWGPTTALRYRGFTTSDYTVATQTGLGAFSWALYVRSELPSEALQQAGSYRAKIIMSIGPNA